MRNVTYAKMFHIVQTTKLAHLMETGVFLS